MIAAVLLWAVLSPLQQTPVARNATHLFHGAKVNPARVRADDFFWQESKREVYASQPSLKSRSKLAGPHVKLMLRGDASRKAIALTFDDGPHPGFTLRLLQVLRAKHVRATFFTVGMMVERFPELARAIVEDGHEIANHTFSHVKLTGLPLALQRVEFRAANEAIKRYTGRESRYSRPPGGDLDRETLLAATSEGLTTVLWTDDPGDYANPGMKVLTSKLMHRLTRGGIVLLHDGSPEMLDLLPGFIDKLRKSGWAIVTLDELGR